MLDELYLDPFLRRHIGEHGAFVLRTNPEHVDLSVRAIRYRREAEEEITVGPALAIVRRKAA